MSKLIKNSILKYPGGKSKELKYIKPFFPEDAKRFIDPFVGGGSVWIGNDYNQLLINDYSKDLINLYNVIKYNNDELKKLLTIFNNDLDEILFSAEVLIKLNGVYDIDELGAVVSDFANNVDIKFFNVKQIFTNEFPKYLKRKINYLKKHGVISIEDTISLLQTAINGSYYNSIRYLYNNGINTEQNDYNIARASIYLYIREFCYSSMFRFGKNGNFNVPYGGKSYNSKRFKSHIDYYSSSYLREKLAITSIYNSDFEQFLRQINLNKDDFIFLDPPYDTEFSTYDDNVFDRNEQKRLADFIKKQTSKWMLVIKDSELIRQLYPETKYNYFDYKNRYAVNFKNRNVQKVNHLIITNYHKDME
jgi:DNA adenine methylase